MLEYWRDEVKLRRLKLHVCISCVTLQNLTKYNTRRNLICITLSIIEARHFAVMNMTGQLQKQQQEASVNRITLRGK